jgi:hypothetical protein
MERDEEETNKEVIGQGRRDSSSRFKCVHWNKRLNKWRARGTVQGKHVHIGCYDIEEDAAHAPTRATSSMALSRHANFQPLRLD